MACHVIWIQGLRLRLLLLQAVEAEDMVESAPESLLRAGIDPPDGCGLSPAPRSGAVWGSILRPGNRKPNVDSLFISISCCYPEGVACPGEPQAGLPAACVTGRTQRVSRV